MVRFIKALTAVCTLLLWGFPLLLIVVTAFRHDAELFRFGGSFSLFSLLPQQPTIENFELALGRADFIRQVINSFVIGLIQSTTILAVCVMAAYVIARAPRRPKRFMMLVIVSVLFIPYQTMVVPLYLIIRDFGLLNSWIGLILPWIAAPMSVLMLKNAIEEVPSEIDEAARIDGAGPLRILFQIILPNIVPSIITTWMINIVGIYDSLLWPLVSINDPSKQVAQVGLASFFTSWERPSFAVAFAAALIVVAPLLPFIFVFQRQFVTSSTSSGLK